MNKKIIFIFSLPRSGSTLLQKILASHPKICTVSEPWLLLPFLYSLKPDGLYTEYSHHFCYSAFQDLIKELPCGDEDFYEALRNFVTELYGKLTDNNAEYFLDKTPRYYLVIPEIVRLLTDAKFIFLFRNPIEIFTSIIRNWCDGHLRFPFNYIDLFIGPKLLADGYEMFKEISIKIQFDELVELSEGTLIKIMRYLQLDYNELKIQDFTKTKLSGRLGDRTGIYYQQINPGVTHKWKNDISTRYRKKYFLNYIKKLDTNTLKTFGYNFYDLKAQLEEINPIKAGGISDRFDLLFGKVYRILEKPLLMKKISKYKAEKQILLHS